VDDCVRRRVEHGPVHGSTIAPLAPATKTRIVISFGHIARVARVYCYDPDDRM
jgi:hypothetical protein